MKLQATLLCIYSILVLIIACDGAKKTRKTRAKWWSLAYTFEMPKTSLETNLLTPQKTHYVASSLRPLTKRQQKVVTAHPGTILAVAKGAKMSIEECKYQFKKRKWNCPTSRNDHGGSIFGRILKNGFRETAFIYAITSASVTHAVAKACSEGLIATCSCAAKRKEPSQDWNWGGCSDNIQFARRFSRKFVDVTEKGRDSRYMMNRHNNMAGRLTVVKEMVRDCKCHGISGECSIKTCWMRLPTFRHVGDLIKERFDGASRIYQGNEGNRGSSVQLKRTEGNSARSRKRQNRKYVFNMYPVDPNHKKPGKRDLVYFENSPDFCKTDKYLGINGTRGRECNATSLGVEGCDLMCCGRGHRTETYTYRERCNCKFTYCCTVKCDYCEKTRVRHTCK